MADDMPLPANYYANTTPVVSDWADVVSFTPETYFTPKSLDDLSAFLTMVLQRDSGGAIRFLGGLHSCAEIVREDIVVDLTRMPLEFTVTGNKVVASGYMHAHDFLERAAANGLSLTALGGTDAQTLAGLISTNTAGATVHTSVYETVDWIEFLTVSDDGRSIVTETVSSSDVAFQAAVCSLGAMGFITRVGFTLVPELYFTGNFVMRPIADVLGDIPQTCADNQFWRIEWIANNDIGLFWNALSAPNPGNGGSDYPVDKTEGLLKMAMELDNAVLKDGPFLNLPLQLMYDYLTKNYPSDPTTGPMRYIIPCDRLAPLPCAMAEWSFDPADLPKVMDVCKTYFGANKWPNLPIEIECTRTDTYLMSAWNWPNLPYIVKLNFQYLTAFLSDAEKTEVSVHLKGVWDALVAAGIPFKAHWGKINFNTPPVVAKNYGLAAFLPHVKPLFMNDYLRARFG